MDCTILHSQYDHSLATELGWLAFIALVVITLIGVMRMDGKWKGLD